MLFKKNGADPDKMAELMGPGAVDLHIRQAIHLCWTIMPAERKSIDEVEKEIRRLVDRALRDAREDEERLRGS